MLIFFLLNSTVVSYSVNQYGVSTSLASWAAGMFVIGTLLGRTFNGIISRYVDEKRLLQLSLLLFSLGILLYFVNLGIWGFIFIRGLHGITVGLATTIIGANVALIIPNERRGEGISYFAVSTALATGVGPFLGIFFSRDHAYSFIFILSFGLGVISVILSFFTDFAKKKVAVPKKSNFHIDGIIEKKALPISLVIFFMTFVFSSIMSYISLYAMERNLVDAASFFFVVYTVSVLVSRPITGRIIDKMGGNYVLYPAFLLFGIGMIILGVSTDGFMLLFSSMIIGLGFGNISSVGQTLAVKDIPDTRISFSTATFFIFFDLGNGIGPLIIGNIISIIGYKYLYILLGGLIFVVGFSYFIKNKKQLEEL